VAGFADARPDRESIATAMAVSVQATYGNAAWSTIRDWLSANATANVIMGNPSRTPNSLLYKSTL